MKFKSQTVHLTNSSSRGPSSLRQKVHGVTKSSYRKNFINDQLFG